MQRKKPEAYSGTYYAEEIKTNERKTKRQHFQDARNEGGESNMLKTRSTARPTGNAKNRGGTAGRKKTRISVDASDRTRRRGYATVDSVVVRYCKGVS